MLLLDFNLELGPLFSVLALLSDFLLLIEYGEKLWRFYFLDFWVALSALRSRYSYILWCSRLELWDCHLKTGFVRFRPSCLNKPQPFCYQSSVSYSIFHRAIKLILICLTIFRFIFTFRWFFLYDAKIVH